MYLRAQVNQSSGIYRGVSTDGIHWNLSAGPVLTTGPSGSWDSSVVFSPDVLWNGTGYLMYYVGSGATTSSTFPANFRQIGVAFSADGVYWTKSAANPVITHGPGPYDARFTRWPSAIFDNGVYKMWYGGETSRNSSTPFLSTIDYATSSDGVHWFKYSNNPVFTGFTEPEFSSTSAVTPSVVKVNGTYLMAFGDYATNIGFATSTDGINWSFNNSTNVLLTTSGWHNGYTGNPSLLVVGNRLLLWYFGIDNSTTRTSPYVSGVGFASCGLFSASPPVTTTFTVITRQVSTLKSTSIWSTTVVSTTTVSSNAPVIEQAIAAVVGFCAALAVTVTTRFFRVRSKRHR